jgi:hypothetical protein
MKMKPAAKYLLPMMLFLAAGFLAGCATTPPVDWGSRVGHYTYAQAVHELGPPNRQIQLSNGAMEYKWFLQPTAAGTGFSAGGMDNNGMSGANPSFGISHGPGVSNQYLRLTFDANGVLTAWSKNY